MAELPFLEILFRLYRRFFLLVAAGHHYG